MQFVQYELTHDEKKAGDLLKAMPNASLAAYTRATNTSGRQTSPARSRSEGRQPKPAAASSPWIDKLSDGPLKRSLQGNVEV